MDESVRKRRSVTLLKGNPKEMEDVELEWDEFGQVTGDWQAKFANYVGLAARSLISILYDTWKDVDDEELQWLWLNIKNYWRIEDDSSRAKVLRQANQAWKKFKQRLITKIILKDRNPVPEYPYPFDDTWEQFVAKKTTIKFLEISRKARESSLMNKNPARLGPKGIRGRKSAWAKQKKDGELLEVHNMKNDRSKTFLLSRTIKTDKGNLTFPSAFQPIVDQIINVDTQFSQGLRVPDAGVDPIIEVMGKEHPGRLRGMGSYIGIKEGSTKYSGRKRRNMNEELWEERVRKLETENEERAERMEAENQEYQIGLKMDFENQLQKFKKEIMSDMPTGRFSTSLFDELDDIQSPISCSLMVPHLTKNVVCATGQVYPFGNGKIHNVPLREGYMKVSVDVVISDFQNFPISTPMCDDITTLGDALYSLIEWPQKAIFLDQVGKATANEIPSTLPLPFKVKSAPYPLDQVFVQKASKVTANERLSTQPFRSMVKSVPDHDDHVFVQKAGKVTSNERPATQPSPIMVKSHTDDQDQRLMKLKKPNVNEKHIIETISDSILSMKPKILQSLYGRMQKRKQDNYFGIHADHGLFEEGMVQFWIDPNEIIRMIFMNNKWLDISSITWFTIMLKSRLLNQHGVSKSTFINPNMITETVCNEDPDRAISYVQKALIMHKEKVFFLAPYWQSGHWVLFIMWPPKNCGMILDSIKGGKTAASYKLTKVMQRAFTKNRIGAGSQIKWLMSNCNQQDHSWECGYYVMKWMFDFVMTKQQQFPQENTRWNDLAPFSNHQLEEIVCTWAAIFTSEHPDDLSRE